MRAGPIALGLLLFSLAGSLGEPGTTSHILSCTGEGTGSCSFDCGWGHEVHVRADGVMNVVGQCDVRVAACASTGPTDSCTARSGTTINLSSSGTCTGVGLVRGTFTCWAAPP